MLSIAELDNLLKEVEEVKQNSPGATASTEIANESVPTLLPELESDEDIID